MVADLGASTVRIIRKDTDFIAGGSAFYRANLQDLQDAGASEIIVCFRWPDDSGGDSRLDRIPTNLTDAAGIQAEFLHASAGLVT